MINNKINSYLKTTIILFILVSLSLNSVQAQHSSQPIAEPMVFDLVRPLSSKKGELEVNTLARKSLTGDHKEVQWAPEVEYAVTDNLSVEFELPISDLNVESYKFAVQGKIGTAREGKFIHGWQYIGEYGKDDKYLEQTALYLAGYRFNRRWSVFNMEGVRRSKLNEQKINEVITNNSVFYDVNSRFTLGLESNLAFNKRAGTYSLLMPQVHIQLAKKLRLQTGFGTERGNRKDFSPTAAIRLIREF